MTKDLKEKTFFEKMLSVQRDLKPIIKDSDNPFFKSKYADINAVLTEIRPLLIREGLFLTQAIKVIEGKNVIKTKIYCDETTGLESEILLPEIADPQKFGACITYFRRFALKSLLALEEEDDDGNTASGKTEAKPKVQGYMPKAMKIEKEDKENAEFAGFMGFSEDSEVCPKCGAAMKLSASTGKKYCSAKCWLK